MDVKFSKLLRLQYFDVGMGENLSTSLGQKLVSVSDNLSERRKARACSEGWGERERDIYIQMSYIDSNITFTYPRSCCKLHLGAALGALAVVGRQTEDYIAVECVWPLGEDKRFIGQPGAGLQDTA